MSYDSDGPSGVYGFRTEKKNKCDVFVYHCGNMIFAHVKIDMFKITYYSNNISNCSNE